jgi:hypothetical protein
MAEHQSADASNLDVMLSAIKDEVAAQNAQVSTLDTKANFGLATAGLLTTALVGLRNAYVDAQKTLAQLPDSHISPFLPHFSASVFGQVANVLTILAVICFFAVLVCSFVAYRVRDFDTVPNSRVLVDKYWDSPPEALKAQLAVSLATALSNDDTMISNKVFWVTWALKSLMLEGLVLLAITALLLTV